MRHIIGALSIILVIACFAEAQAATALPKPPGAATYTFEKTSLGPFSSLDNPCCSPDGRHCLRASRNLAPTVRPSAKRIIYLDEKRVGECAGRPSLMLAPNGTHWAATVRDGAKSLVIADGQASTPYDEVSVNVSSAGVVYLARTDKKWVAVAKGKTSQEYDRIGNPFLAPNGRLAFWCKTGQTEQFIVDGKPLAEGRIVWSALSPDGNHAACLLKDGAQYTMILDGRKLGPYENVVQDGIQFSPDSNHLVFSAQQGGKWRVLTDGTPSPAYDEVWYVRFSSDGKHHAYCARIAGLWSVIVNGKPVSSFSAPAKARVAEVALSPDGKRTACVLRSGKKAAAIIDGQKGPEFDRIMSWDGYGTFFFSPDRKHVAYMGCRGVGKNTVSTIVCDSHEGPAFDDTGVPFFLNDGRCYYRASKGKEHFMVNAGKQEGPYAGVLDAASDGVHLAYIAREPTKQYVVLDSTQGPEFDAVSEMAFSPGGRHFAYLVKKDKQELLVLNGQAVSESFDGGKNFGGNSRRLQFSADGSLEFLAVKDDTLYRVKLRPLSDR